VRGETSLTKQLFEDPKRRMGGFGPSTNEKQLAYLAENGVLMPIYQKEVPKNWHP
jgi:hypothetical protein